MALTTGVILNKLYRIESTIGHGGMADVYLAYDINRSTYLAIKLLKEDLSEDIVFLRRFKREAQNLAKLQHPNIVRFYGLEEDHNHIFLLQDFIDGPTLRKVIKNHGKPFSNDEILNIITPICSALNFAHQTKIIHCDLKPANIMLDRQGKVFLTDFGIARISEGATTVTMVGAGTPAYMAPEQITGKVLTPQTDIYSLGIILFEMLTGGERPFIGETASINGSTFEKVRWEQLKAVPPSLRLFNQSVSPALEAVVMKCLAKNPKSRYKNIVEFNNALLDVLEGAQYEIDENTALKGNHLKSVRDLVNHTYSSTMDQPPQIPNSGFSNPPANIPQGIYGNNKNWKVGTIILAVAFFFLIIGFIFIGKNRVASSKQNHDEITSSENTSKPTNTQQIETKTLEPVATFTKAAPTPQMSTPASHYFTDCNLNTYINPGDLIRVSLGGGNNGIRSEADTAPANNRIGIAKSGEVLLVIDGPKCDRGGYLLWRVVPTLNTDWDSGWTPEISELDKVYWLEPLPSWNPCNNSLASHLKLGDQAYVSIINGTSNKVRATPDLNGNDVGRINVGESLSILEGPVCQDGYIWWNVQSENGISGWTAEGKENDFWLLPKY